MAKGGEKMTKKGGSFWLKIAATVLMILAGAGVIPQGWGLLSEFVIQNADKIEVTQESFNGYDAHVVRVIDGDTIEVKLVDTPEALEVLRLIGVDTPETVHPSMPVQFFGLEATRYTKQLCFGRSVRLHLQKNGPRRGKYGRLLVYVELDGGKILNEKIIENGYGYSYTKYPHEYTDKYNALQLEAKTTKRGLWATVKFVDMPKWLRESNPGILE
ncbi:thermonuclease family protein [Candidatus Pacearchaeota archaeon]|nr:thermonuclease family protein [Candidatus Pacearchaeota archaeon]